ncbi:MAG: two-component system response regulator [Bacteriovoracaceae bacterium]|nr:two-component system response regulator [Bacteriovoracaceae bacterium]
MARKLRILSVDDNRRDSQLLSQLLSKLESSVSITFVSDGCEALDFLFRRKKFFNCQRPDLILLDINLPKRTGYEVLAEIKNDPSLKAIPVLMLTASDRNEDIQRSYDLHANAHLTKPASLAEFEELVRAVEIFWLKKVQLPKSFNEEDQDLRFLRAGAVPEPAIFSDFSIEQPPN